MLDNFLSNSPEVKSIGELRNLPSHLNKTGPGAEWNWSCTCGKSFRDCHVWADVRRRYEADTGQHFLSVETCSENFHRTRLFYAYLLFAALIPIRRVRQVLLLRAYRLDSLREIGHSCYQILDAFGRSTGSETIIDSSKTPEYLLALILARPKDIELKVIHLIRDGRAVLHSKRIRAEEGDGRDAVFKIVPSTRAWCVTNLQLLLSRSLFGPEDVIVVHYEDICSDREGVLKNICARLGIPFDKHMLHLSRDGKHNIGGSAHRFAWSVETPVRLDQRWKSGMPWHHKAVYYMVAGIFHKTFGY
jgi:hypothetical protein